MQPCVRVLAFADDVVLVSSRVFDLQSNLEVLYAELHRAGLLFNSGKCCAVSLVTSGHDHTVKAITQPSFRVTGNWIPQVAQQHLWSYVGVQFRDYGVADIAEKLGRISRAPLKSQQSLHLVRTYLLHKYLHAWTFGRLNVDALRRLDRLVRGSVRPGLAVPRDTPMGYFHAPIRSSDLGVLQLPRFIPRLRHFDHFGRSSVDYIAECSRTDIVTVTKICNLVTMGLPNTLLAI
ncbi:hypothetical protein Zmor_021578 [Zophobas morio]|uniref:Reverse transcriptase domain-containing protein n=1 Tax=Zophobas morio TaxID=2755281 RepID=A0AA38I5U7_9CUCU|nr:hypothetical protein Zmor_021578 [Zophobas morio]